MLHIALHVLIPLIVALLCYRQRWLSAWLIMLCGMLIDIDHLLADPIYDPNRCSVGFHPLHTAVPILIYIALLLPKRTRLIGLGLCIHIALDTLDCQQNLGIWYASL